MSRIPGTSQQPPSPLANPAIREFLDGLAVLIARRILREGERGRITECPAGPEAESGGGSEC